MKHLITAVILAAIILIALAFIESHIRLTKNHSNFQTNYIVTIVVTNYIGMPTNSANNIIDLP